MSGTGTPFASPAYAAGPFALVDAQQVSSVPQIVLDGMAGFNARRLAMPWILAEGQRWKIKGDPNPALDGDYTLGADLETLTIDTASIEGLAAAIAITGGNVDSSAQNAQIAYDAAILANAALLFNQVITNPVFSRALADKAGFAVRQTSPDALVDEYPGGRLRSLGGTGMGLYPYDDTVGIEVLGGNAIRLPGRRILVADFPGFVYIMVDPAGFVLYYIRDDGTPPLFPNPGEAQRSLIAPDGATVAEALNGGVLSAPGRRLSVVDLPGFAQVTTDPAGFVISATRDDGLTQLPGRVFRVLDIPGFIQVVVDPAGFVISAVRSDGLVQLPGRLLSVVEIPGFISVTIDPAGFVISSVRDDGTTRLPGRRLSLATIPGFLEVVTDPAGFVISAQRDDGSPPEYPGSGSTPTNGAFSAAEDNALNAEVAAYSASRSLRTAPSIQRPVWRNNLFLGAGQSFGQGVGGGQDLLTDDERASAQPYPGVLMVGDCVRSTNSTVWNPYGGAAVLKSYRETVVDTGGLQSPAQQAALPVGDGAGPVILGRALEHLQNARAARLGAAALDQRMVAMTIAVSGSSIVELSPGNTPNYWNQALTAADRFIEACIADTGDYGLAGVFIDQGQTDYNLGSVPATYKANFIAYIDAIHTQITVGKFGQTKRVPIFIVQTGGDWVRDTYPVGIGQAQAEIAAERSDVFLIGTTYDKTNNSDEHPDSNGYYWNACHGGDALEQIIVENRDFRIPAPYRVLVRGQEWRISYDVESAPVQFKDSYEASGSGSSQTQVTVSYSGKGLATFDGAGALPLGTPTIIAPQLLGGTFGRARVGSVRFDCGRRDVSGGTTSIADSCERPLLMAYRYVPGSGQPVGANVPALTALPWFPPNKFTAHWSRIAEEV